MPVDLVVFGDKMRVPLEELEKELLLDGGALDVHGHGAVCGRHLVGPGEAVHGRAGVERTIQQNKQGDLLVQLKHGEYLRNTLSIRALNKKCTGRRRNG